MARPRNQTARRAQLITAAGRAVSTYGPARVRVADIADAAGVARGSVHYYFRDLGDLLEQVYKDAVDRFFTQRLDAVTGLRDARDKLVVCARRGLPTGPDDELVRLLYWFGPETTDNPVFAAHGQGLFDRQVAVYTGILEVGEAQGHFTLTESAIDIAANLVTLEDGYGLHIVTGNRSVTPERALSLVLGYARTATGCANLTPDRPVQEHPRA
ncbi:TetR/AcrR family transcriptional regulator [Streptomyces sp. NPDC052043]|uniref:TetR/AcrR family transcriptional regulator n=1 Tax=Streptomyces sp. NPDC052043 TaxID=3365684 RepID=UPI0037D031F4